MKQAFTLCQKDIIDNGDIYSLSKPLLREMQKKKLHTNTQVPFSIHRTMGFIIQLHCTTVLDSTFPGILAPVWD